MKEFDVAETDERQTSRIVKTAVAPRPVAWISTRSPDGIDNLAPFSSYNYVDARRPVVVFNTGKRAGGELKDTVRNVVDTGEFAVNVVTESYLERMDHTSKHLPPEESEFDLAGIDRAPCRTIEPARVPDAAVAMECTLHDTLEIHDRVMVLGDVRYLHVNEAVTTDGEIDATKLHPVGRLGGPYYTIAEPVEFERRF